MVDGMLLITRRRQKIRRIGKTNGASNQGISITCGNRTINEGWKMTKIKTSNNYKDFMKDFLKRDEVGQVSPPDSFDVVVKNQGRWKSYRFIYDCETKWCSTPTQVDDILRKHKHYPDKPYIETRKILAPPND